jgi:hypothetical protein
LGRYCKCSMARKTRSRVGSEIPGFRLTTAETVWIETSATRATSMIVTLRIERTGRMNVNMNVHLDGQIKPQCELFAGDRSRNSGVRRPFHQDQREQSIDFRDVQSSRSERQKDLGRFIVPEGLEDSAQGFNPISANLLPKSSSSSSSSSSWSLRIEVVAKGPTDGRRKQASGGSFAYTTKETTEDEGRRRGRGRFGQQASAYPLR